MIVTKQFTFHAAHFLPGHPHCGNIHGHTYKVEVSISGKIDKKGMVIDFSELKNAINPLITQLDHNLINKIISNPTAENIAVWLWNNLESYDRNFALHEIKVFETETCWVAYRG